MDEYVKAVTHEIELRSKEAWPKKVTSIFFGGGTPSLIPANHIESILQKIRFSFESDSEIEITLEANPENVNMQSAKQWKEIGINRISLGAQSMNDGELKRLGRHHTRSDIICAIQILRDASFSNISMDLIFGLENQTLDGWKKTLEDSISFQPDHISTYNLTIEKNTVYDKEFQNQKLHLPTDDIQADMMIEEKKILQSHGYDPYEISNASKPGFASKHNLLYWTGKPYLGVGVSAHSFRKSNAGFERFWNTKNIPQYIDKTNNNLLPLESTEHLSDQTHLGERLLTGLRLSRGIDMDLLKAEGFEINSELNKQIQILTDSGHLIQENHRIRISSQHTPLTTEIVSKLLP